jgi:hypothetical protein
MIPQSKAASVHVASLQSVYLTRRGNLGTSRAARNGQSLPGVCGGGFSAGLGLRVVFSDGEPRSAGCSVHGAREGAEIREPVVLGIPISVIDIEVAIGT